MYSLWISYVFPMDFLCISYVFPMYDLCISYGLSMDFLYWSGGAEPAHGMRISCVRAGAGWEILSSVRNAGKGAKRPQKSSRNVQLHSETRKSEILQGVGRSTPSKMSVKALVCARFQECFCKKTEYFGREIRG